MSPRFTSVSLSRLGSLVTMLVIASGCSTGGPILTGTTPLGSATPTPAATATPVPTATPTPTPTATPVPTPGPGQTTVTIDEGSISLPGGYIAIFTPFTLSQAGSLDFTADWVSSLNDIDIALANGSCTSDQFSAGTCSFAGTEESATMKPEEMVLALAAGTYTHMIGNFSAASETISYRLLFAPTASASLSDARAAVAAARLAHPPVLVRMSGKFSRPGL